MGAFALVLRFASIDDLGMLFRPIACFLLLATVAAGQTSTDSPQQQPKPKSKRVWTNDDIGSVPGTINVVGSPRKESGKSNDTTSAQPAKPKECDSDSWPEAVAAVLGAQGVNFNAKYWNIKFFGGGCYSGMSVSSIAPAITGDYTLDDGQRIRIDADARPGLPNGADAIAAVQSDRPFLVAMNERAYLATDVAYIDHQYMTDGGIVHVYAMTKVTLTDPISGDRKMLDLASGPPKSIQGSISVSVTSRR